VTTTEPDIDASRRHPETERWLTAAGIPWKLCLDVPLGRIDEFASLHNQARLHAVDPEVVDRYTADLLAGDQFPPVLARESGNESLVLVGGNHRHQSHKRAGRTTIDAYIIDVPADAALVLAYEDNRRHGLAPSEDERAVQAMHLMASGLNQTDAARIVGISQPTLSQAVAVRAAAEIADDAGIGDWYRQLPKGTRYRLTALTGDVVVFTEAIAVVTRTGLNATEVDELVRAVRDLDTTRALIELGAIEGDNLGRDRGRGNTKAGRPTWRRFQDQLNTVNRYRPADIAKTTPDPVTRLELRQAILNTARHLQAVLEALR